MDIDHPLLQISEVGEYEDFEEYSKVLIESALDAQKQDGTHHYRLNDIYSLASFLILLNSSITDALQIVELKRNFQEIAEDYEFESTNNKKEESKTTHGSKSIIPLIRIVEAILRMCDLAPNTASHIKRRRDYIEEKYDSSSEISESDLKLLDDDVDYWYDSVADALAEKRRIAVVEEGTLSINDLLNNPGEFFRMDIQEWLDPAPNNDFYQACRILAIGSTTGCVMMALRCVEYCLRDWYLHETGTEIEQSWGRVLAALEGEFENKDRPAVLSNLDYLRERRNEVNHPVRNPDYKEAEDTLVAVRQTVTEIYRQLD